MPRYPEPNPRELKKMEEETKKETPLPYFETAQKKLQKSILYTRIFKQEKDLNEISCPVYSSDDPKGYVTTEYCKDKAQGLGCEDLKICEAYNKQKELQEKYPEINWENIDDNKPELLSKINLIKKGAIINP